MMYLLSGHYAYKGRYILGGSVRADGTTRFGDNKRWMYAPGVYARWNISDENFMTKVREKAKLSMLAISPGWGLVGNPPNQDYLYMNRYTPSSSYLGTVSMNADNLKLINLGPEHIMSYNLGVNLGFFDERLTMRLDLYSRITKDMLMYGGISNTSGHASLLKNVGTMRNSGWEFNINGNRLLKKGKFSLDFYVNFANNQNRITKMDENVLELKNTDFSRKNRDYLTRVQLDNPFGSIYGFRSKGVYQYNYSTAQNIAKGTIPERLLAKYGAHTLQEYIDMGVTFPIALNSNGQVIYDAQGKPLQMKFCYSEGSQLGNFNGGDAIYEDVNHDGQINELDIVYLGSSLPKLTGGFGFTLNYGNWRLSTQFNYRLDYDVYNRKRLDLEAMNGNYNQSEAVNYRWRAEGDVTTIPRALSSYYVTNYNTLISDRFIEDATFLRLNYLQLSYSFDKKLIKKWHLNQLKLSASARNLFCLTKYTGVDPEVGYGGTSMSVDDADTPAHYRQYTFNVTVEF